jgi:hypothetical protein
VKETGDWLGWLEGIQRVEKVGTDHVHGKVGICFLLLRDSKSWHSPLNRELGLRSPDVDIDVAAAADEMAIYQSQCLEVRADMD